MIRRTMSDQPAQVERSVFARLASITTWMAIVLLLIVFVFFALTVNPHFGSPRLNEQLRAAHFKLVGPVLLLMAAVVMFAHARLRRLLEPLRDLDDGVARLTRGDLDVALQRSTRDEFASLTNAFNQMVARVRQMISARDQLLVDVSHELRSPLTRMKVALELLPEGDIRERMAADVRQMEAMVTELLELERLRDGRHVQKAPVDLLAVIDEVTAPFASRQPPVHVRRPAEVVVVDGDARMLAVVFRNLLDNAVSYSLPDSRPVELWVDRVAGTVVIRVSDDGPGIPESEVANVFEPFYRLDRSRSRRTGGYGLGLSICKRVVEAHDGTIRIERGSPRGTTFVVSLPS